MTVAASVEIPVLPIAINFGSFVTITTDLSFFFVQKNEVIKYYLRGFCPQLGAYVGWTSINEIDITPTVTSPQFVGSITNPHIIYQQITVQ